ncbi:MAG: phytoene desaturase family protein [Lautropia sp.]
MRRDAAPRVHVDRPVAVIGGGLGGLAAAVTLAARGHRVVLFEANEWLGGKAAVLEVDGWRFDMGPTILTLPSVIARILREADRSLELELPMTRLDPQWRCFFDGGRRLDLVADTDAMGDAIDAFAGDARSGDGYRRYLAQSERLHAISERFFFWKSVSGVGDTFDWRANLSVSTLRDLLALRMGRGFGSVVRAHMPDPRVAQMVDHFAQYIGSDPFEAPAVVGAIAHMQTHDGVWYPRGGTAAVPAMLARLAARLGVDVRTGTPVEAIDVAHGRVDAVVAEGGERTPVSAVVSNMDSVRTYRELLGGVAPRGAPAGSRPEPACSGVVLYLGLDRAYPQLAHHNFVFSRDAHEEFDAIYRRGEPAPDPTCYVAAPARTDPSVAPPGGEALYVLVHAPYLRAHHDWDAMLPPYRRVIVDKLARTAGLEQLASRIRVERWLTPADIGRRYRVLDGAIYGLASHGRMFGAFKPGNRRTDVPGLYLAGGAAHPGPGMPMVLMSGWIAADCVDADLRERADV